MRTVFLPSVASIIVLLTQTQPANATPFPLELFESLLNKRCTNPCGYYSQLCCTSSQVCSTNSANQAICVDGTGASGGGWQYYTTVFTSRDFQTVTSVWSSFVTQAPNSDNAQCNPSLGQSLCGTACCSDAEVCENGACVGGSSSGAVGTAATTSQTAVPPLRPTSSGAATITQSASTTVPFIAPVGTNGATVVVQASSGGGLSGGAIAGIVIGTIVGVFLLILFLICFCAKEALDGFFALFGRRRRKEDTVYEERYSHHSGSRPYRRTWFGVGPTRPSSPTEKKSGIGFWATILLIVGTIALCLGLRRKGRDSRSNTESNSYYTYYSDPSSASSESSDRRTRRTRESRSTRRSYRN